MGFKSFWEKLKVIDSWSLQKDFPNYHFNPRIWRISILFFMLWLFFAAFSIGFSFDNHIYFKCSEKSITVCDNPFYNMIPCPDKSGVICEKMFFNPGEIYGQPPNFFYQNMSFVGALALIVPFGINHYLYNRKREVSL